MFASTYGTSLAPSASIDYVSRARSLASTRLGARIDSRLLRGAQSFCRCHTPTYACCWAAFNLNGSRNVTTGVSPRARPIMQVFPAAVILEVRRIPSTHRTPALSSTPAETRRCRQVKRDLVLRFQIVPLPVAPSLRRDYRRPDMCNGFLVSSWRVSSES